MGERGEGAEREAAHRKAKEGGKRYMVENRGREEGIGSLGVK